MSKHNEVGKAGEELARQHLVSKGYKILDYNWFFQKKEIDIVAQNHDIIVFAEVKTRSTLAFELPQEAVTLTKQKKLVKAADAYLQEKEIFLPSRFDIVAVLLSDPPQILEHIEDAFAPHELL